MSDIQIISNVRGYLDHSNTAWLNAEDVARGFGFTYSKDGVEYIRWERVNSYLESFGYFATSGENSQRVGKDDYLPENMVYRLGFKANNETAIKFQTILADEVLPSIRRSGGYMVAKVDETPEELMARCIVVANETINRRNERIKELEAENSSQSAMIAEQNKEIASLMETVEEMKPKVSYYETILASKELMTTTQIALDYGMSAQKLNNLLHQFGIQYKVKDQWILYSKYAQNGYVHSIPIEITRANGRRETKNNTQWRQKGRLFIYDTLKERGILPLIEQD